MPEEWMRVSCFCLDDESCAPIVMPQLENSISKAIQMIGRYYVQYFNHKYYRAGTFWEGRYKASLIDAYSGEHEHFIFLAFGSFLFNLSVHHHSTLIVGQRIEVSRDI